jgi:predicted nucleotidyltransferase
MLALERLSAVARALSAIQERRFVFAGASILPLLLNDPHAPSLRETFDVDVVVNVLTYGQWYHLRPRLYKCGFRERMDVYEHNPRNCLFYLEDLQVDIMPMEPNVLGFASQWLAVGFEQAESHVLPDGQEILVLSVPCFLAAKLEAFQQRGWRDILMSKDLRDIVSLLDGRLQPVSDIGMGPLYIRLYVADATKSLLGNSRILDLIPDLLRDPTRERRFLNVMDELAERPF